MDVETLIASATEHGVTLKTVGDRLLYRPRSAATPDLIHALRQHKTQIIAHLERQRQESFPCWVLEEWRRISIPDWRRVLAESKAQGNASREEYARWMLREILLDPNYEEA